MKLYQITGQYQNIAALLDDPELAENQDVLSALDSIQDDFETKVEQTIFIMKNIEAEIEPIDAEIKRLQAMKKARQNNIDRIKDRLRANMQAIDKSKLKCGLFSVSYRIASGNKLQLDEAEFLANCYDEELIVHSVKPNNAAIKAALKNGADILGAKLVDSEVLTIK
ncbi:siphovirus Gp157 family protein [Testudinibacter sp. P80/BLE/0925]